MNGEYEWFRYKLYDIYSLNGELEWFRYKLYDGILKFIVEWMPVLICLRINRKFCII